MTARKSAESYDAPIYRKTDQGCPFTSCFVGSRRPTMNEDMRPARLPVPQ